MDKHHTRSGGQRTLRAIRSTLEEQLPKLDEMGAFIAAAHVDAAIQQLRIDEYG